MDTLTSAALVLHAPDRPLTPSPPPSLFLSSFPSLPPSLSPTGRRSRQRVRSTMAGDLPAAERGGGEGQALCSARQLSRVRRQSRSRYRSVPSLLVLPYPVLCCCPALLTSPILRRAVLSCLALSCSVLQIPSHCPTRDSHSHSSFLVY